MSIFKGVTQEESTRGTGNFMFWFLGIIGAAFVVAIAVSFLPAIDLSPEPASAPVQSQVVTLPPSSFPPGYSTLAKLLVGSGDYAFPQENGIQLYFDSYDVSNADPALHSATFRAGYPNNLNSRTLLVNQTTTFGDNAEVCVIVREANGVVTIEIWTR